MVARRTGIRRTPVSARMRAASSALLRRITIRRSAQPPRPGGQARRRSCTPAGCIRTRTSAPSGRWTRDPRHPTNVSRFAGRHPSGVRPGRLSAARGAHTTASWQGEALTNDHVARGAHLPQHLRNPDHPIGTLMQTTIDARNADGERQAERSEERDGEHQRLAPRSASLTKSNARDAWAYRSGAPASRSSLRYAHCSSAATTAIVRISAAGRCTRPSRRCSRRSISVSITTEAAMMRRATVGSSWR